MDFIFACCPLLLMYFIVAFIERLPNYREKILSMLNAGTKRNVAVCLYAKNQVNMSDTRYFRWVRLMYYGGLMASKTGLEIFRLCFYNVCYQFFKVKVFDNGVQASGERVLFVVRKMYEKYKKVYNETLEKQSEKVKEKINSLKDWPEELIIKAGGDGVKIGKMDDEENRPAFFLLPAFFPGRFSNRVFSKIEHS